MQFVLFFRATRNRWKGYVIVSPRSLKSQEALQANDVAAITSSTNLEAC
jgi:hypothetical protein